MNNLIYNFWPFYSHKNFNYFLFWEKIIILKLDRWLPCYINKMIKNCVSEWQKIISLITYILDHFIIIIIFLFADKARFWPAKYIRHNVQKNYCYYYFIHFIWHRIRHNCTSFYACLNDKTESMWMFKSWTVLKSFWGGRDNYLVLSVSRRPESDDYPPHNRFALL